PHAAVGGMPRAAVSAPAGGLLLGDHRGRRGRALEPELVNRIERRRELPEQPALRHAPPRRELRRRHAVPGHAILRATSATTPTAWTISGPGGGSAPGPQGRTPPAGRPRRGHRIRAAARPRAPPRGSPRSRAA